jgi:hypothetical protein
MKPQFSFRQILPVILLACSSNFTFAQTDNDYDMMAQGLFCAGPMASFSSWDHYWEGKLNRTNENLGTVSTKVYSIMGNYGISKKLNFLFNVPYVQTKASAGTFKGMEGFQDLSLFLKYMPLKKEVAKGTFRLALVAGYSTPLSNYTADFLPFSIGLRSRTLSGRVLLDYERNKLFITASGAYMRRNNIKIDRDAYYTTEMHYSNEVEMPDAANVNLRAGYRSKTFIAEAVMNHFKTLGGFDITRNNMPFPSNRMIATTIGPSIKWRPEKLRETTFVAGTDFTVSGRNMGQSTTYYGGIFYIINVNRK